MLKKKIDSTMNFSKKSKIIIVGGVTWRNTAHSHLGGTTVLMENFIDYCDKEGVPNVVVPSNKYYGHYSSLKNLIDVLIGFLKVAQRGDVAMVNISSRTGVFTLLPFILLLSKIYGVEVVCRKFAGSINKYLDNNCIKKKIALYLFKKTKISFFETMDIIKWLEKNGYKGHWFPNVREGSAFRTPDRYDKRLVFVGQVYEDKGVDILVRLSNRLPNDYQIDIYGPVVDPKYNEEFFGRYKANYKGTLKPEAVAQTLASYNIMVLPTWWNSEGYPGVIIEAFSVGLPVISTRIGGIPEMVVDGECGYLVDAKDEIGLEKTVLSISQKTYESLKEGALRNFEVYDSDKVNARIVSQMISPLKKRVDNLVN